MSMYSSVSGSLIIIICAASVALFVVVGFFGVDDVVVVAAGTEVGAVAFGNEVVGVVGDAVGGGGIKLSLKSSAQWMTAGAVADAKE